jgi:DTW domain-containing protein
VTTPLLPDFEPRAVCLDCRRPASFCYCATLPKLATRTRVVLLQHPRERDVGIGTARMASLCLPNSELHVGVYWQGTSVLRRATADPSRPAALLYPGKDAVDIAVAPPSSPITLIVVDGTWWQSKQIVRENPELAALPRYAFTPPVPSQYRIRREPKPNYVSTIEALVYALGFLEGDTERFHAMLAPFRAMIDAQIHAQDTAVSSYRHRKWTPPQPLS